MWGWGSICSAARKIDKTVREDVPAKLKQKAPDPKIMQGNWDSVCFVARKIGKTVKENAPDQRIFWTTAVEEMIKDGGLPGVRPLCRAWKESRRNRSGVASQMHSHDKVTDERERAKREKCMMLSQAIFIPTAPTNQQPQHVARYCAGSYPPEKLSGIPKIMQGNWDSVCFVARKIGKTLRENAPDQRIFWTTFAEEMIKDSGLPGVRRLYRAWKESLRNRSGVASQMHSHDKVNGERNRLMNVKGQKGRSV